MLHLMREAQAAIEDYMQTKMTRFERVKLATGYTQPDEDLIEAVREASSTRLKPVSYRMTEPPYKAQGTDSIKLKL